jgi:tetratricopeptide (TPR) repeat protein
MDVSIEVLALLIRRGCRDAVKLDGIPITWTTNLDDNDLRHVYLLLRREQDTKQSNDRASAPPTSGGFAIRISLVCKSIPFKDGFCLVYGTSDTLWAYYASFSDWGLLNAQAEEVAELREEQAQEKKTEKVLLKAQHEYLCQKTKESIDRKAYDEALTFIEEQLQLWGNHTREKRLWADTPVTWAVSNLARFPTSETGIAILDKQPTNSWIYLRFAKDWLQNNRGNPEMAFAEINKILRAAVNRFPTDGLMYKDICCFFEKNSQFALAIEYCQLAAENGAKDGRKTGFAGRLKRLRKKYGSPPPANW